MARPFDIVQSSGEYEVAVAITPAAGEGRAPRPGDDGDGVAPGFDQTAGFRSQGRQARDYLLEKGDEAVRIATESIARQIGAAAQRIATALDAQASQPAAPGSLSLESVEVSFGVTLSAGVEALFTAMAESSAQVTVVLRRRAPDNPASRA
ncbi:MAG TPA: hypothetical protein VF223_02430 [Trebonia sp.]